MNSSTLLALLVTVLISLTLLVVAGVGSWRGRLANRSLRRALENNTDLIALASKWWRRRLTGFAIGFFTGGVVSVFAIFWMGMDRDRSAVGTVFIGSLAFGLLAAAVGGALRFRVGAAPSRLADPKFVRLPDYVSTLWRWLARLAALLSIICLLIPYLARNNASGARGLPNLLEPHIAVSLLAIVLLVIFEFGSRAIVARSIRAESMAGLRGEDALRGLAIRDLAQATFAMGLFAVFLSVPVLSIGLSMNDMRLSSLDEIVSSVAILVVIVGVTLSVVLPIGLRVPARDDSQLNLRHQRRS